MYAKWLHRRTSANQAAAAMVAGLFVLPVQAYNPFGRGDIDSYAIINKIPANHGPVTTAEAYLIVLIDPPVAKVSGLSNTLQYDSTRYVFREDLSGLLCEFAQGGSCPPPSAQHGMHLISDLPMVDLQVGQALPGTTLTVENDAAAGVVSVDYRLSTLLTLEGADRNFYAFVFEALQPYNPYATQVTFHDQPGNYDFTQLAASCVTTEHCGSDTPVYGFTVTSVPEPASVWMALAGLAAGARYRSPRKRRITSQVRQALPGH